MRVTVRLFGDPHSSGINPTTECNCSGVVFCCFTGTEYYCFLMAEATPINAGRENLRLGGCCEAAHAGVKPWVYVSLGFTALTAIRHD